MHKQKKEKLLSVLLRLDVCIASVALVLLVGVTFLGVVMRYLVGEPFGWIEEVQAALIVWVVFAAGGAAYRTRNHSAIDMLYNIFPLKAQKVINAFIAITVACVLSYLCYTSFEYIQLFVRTGRETSVLHVSYVLIYAIVPVSCILQVLNYILCDVLHRCDESFDIDGDEINE